MKRIGSAVVTLLLGLVACSSPNLLSGPRLEAQFGTAEDDIGVDVATRSTGIIYSLSKQRETEYEDDGNYETGFSDKAVVRRYNSSGSLVWQRSVRAGYCNYDFPDSCGRFDAIGVDTDSSSNSYTLSAREYTEGDCTIVRYTSVTKYSSTGNYIRDFAVGGTGQGLGDSDGYSRNAALAVDNSGNVYVGLEDAYVDSSEACDAVDRSIVISKYTTNGSLQWQRISTIGEVTDILISPGGSLYVAGTKGLARYSTSGSLVWTKAIGPLENVVVSGSNIYTRYRKDIRKFDASGKQLWLKTQTGLNTLIGQDISGDTSGNVYLSGKYAAGTGNYSPFVRKLNSSGSVLWTKTYGTPAYDDALGIATITGSEIYVTGETQGSLSHTNIGGRDGYLRKLNSSGNLVWSR